MEACRAVGRQQQTEDVGVVDLGPGEYIDEIQFENDMIEFIILFSPGMQTYYHENMAKQYFSPFSFFFFFNLIERLGPFFFFFHFIPSSYQPVSEDRLVEACRAVGRQQQTEDVGVVALVPGEYIDEIRFENDMIEFIFLFLPGMQNYYQENMARQYFFSYLFFFFFQNR